MCLIGIAAALTIAEDKESKHGPLELLFTVDEETALTGAFNLEKGFLPHSIRDLVNRLQR
jgi:dipeptidase D